VLDKELKYIEAYNLLLNYNGNNPYLKKLKYDVEVLKRKSLTTKQIDYIINNYNKEPETINKIIEITPYLGEHFKEKYNLGFVPKKMLVEKFLAENENSYHVIGKLTKNQKNSELFWLPKTQLVDDLFFDNVEIDIDFSKYEKLDKLKRKPFKHQEEGIKFLVSRKGCILSDDMGLGKCIGLNEYVYTPNGIVKSKDIKVGDFLIDENGEPVKVKKVIYNEDKRKLYKVKFNDNTSLTVTDDHLWKVIKRDDNKELFLTTKQLCDKDNEINVDGEKIKTYYKINDEYIWKIQLPKPIEFKNNKALITDPYLYGKILSETYYKDKPNLKNKEIKNEYKYSSIYDRISLLKGLFDNNVELELDEYLKIIYKTKYINLAKDIIEVTQSLGGVGEYIKENDYYKLSLIFPEEIIPMSIDMDLFFYLKHKHLNSKYEKYIVDIEYVGMNESVCYLLDSKSHLFVTKGGIVTHNTYQAIISALEINAKKVLIVCPSSVKINWEREIKNFDDNVVIVNGRKWDSSRFTIINYDILKNFHTIGNGIRNEEGILIENNKQIVNSKFDLVIIDEAHYLKNYKSIRAKILSDIILNHGIERVWLLTGTPIVNRPIDFYNLLKLIRHPVADRWDFYVKRYCDAKKINKRLKSGKKKTIWITNGASNLDELSRKTKNVLLRRLKDEVIDLPEKIIMPQYHELTQEKRLEYENLWEDYLEKRREEKKRGRPRRELVELTLLRKFIAMENIPYTIEDVNEIIENGNKVVIFTTFTDELMELHEHFGNKSVIHYGGMSDKDKQISVDEFQNNDKIKVFIGNIISAGVGITLTKSNYVIFNSFDWVTGNNEQAEDRCYRIGQTKRTIVKYQLFVNTVSEIMWNVLKNKKDIINTILSENKNSYSESEYILDYILKNNFG
jgi:SWI/SNF-related matrix-associated actin-dependent regulator 1 of chromatin subfamily A